MTIIVAKFGGTSVATYQAMQSCVEILQANKNIRISVLSACSKITDQLVKLANGENEEQRKITLEIIKNIHYDIINQLQDPNQVIIKIDQFLESIANLARSAELATNAMLADEIVAHGELMSTTIFVQLLREKGEKVVWLDARKIIKTNSDFGQAVFDQQQTKNNLELLVELLVQPELRIVTQGFIGSDINGRTSTLGRGGSDYTAAIFSELTKASLLQIWTDVHGIFTIDPRITQQAKRIAEISFAEAAEMATFGAKILHPSTLIPAIRSNIPVFVGNTFAYQQPGTMISSEVEDKPDFRGIAIRRNQTLITITSLTMLHTTGFLAKIFSLVAKYEIALDVITTSEVSIAMTIDKTSKTSGANKDEIPVQLIEELSQYGKIEIEKNLGLIAIIGNNLYRRPCLNKVFAQLKVPLRCISQGASSHNICMLIDGDKIDQTVVELHQLLFN